MERGFWSGREHGLCSPKGCCHPLSSVDIPRLHGPSLVPHSTPLCRQIFCSGPGSAAQPPYPTTLRSQRGKRRHEAGHTPGRAHTLDPSLLMHTLSLTPGELVMLIPARFGFLSTCSFPCSLRAATRLCSHCVPLS